MRKIKFRFWHKSWEQMIYSNNNGYETKREFYPIEFEIGFSHYNQDDFSDLMQYTGLKDKNGKEIYEGDITDAKETVIFNNGCFRTTHDNDTQNGAYLTSKRCEYIEIIGNIHQNKDLL